jgi:methylated-DNA-[protein]-cysteine S-methyltransferase
MSDISFALFETPIGRCAIAWNAHGVAAVGFPEGGDEATRRRMVRRYPAARESSPPRNIRSVIEDIVALLAGEARDLSRVAIDIAGISDFNRRVYEIARTIPAGSTLTYGEIAARLGDRALARDVGEALGQNPFPIIVPCHRVLAADGKVGGFSAPGGTKTKLKLLSIEGARRGDPVLFDRLPWALPPRRG